MKIYLSENDYYFDNKGEPVPALSKRNYEKMVGYEAQAIELKRDLTLTITDVKNLEEQLKKEKEKNKGNSRGMILVTSTVEQIIKENCELKRKIGEFEKVIEMFKGIGG